MRREVRLSGSELINRMDPHFFGEFHLILECPGMPDRAAFDAASAAGDDEAYDRLREQARKAVAAVDWVVSWPECVINPRFDDDANYGWVQRA